MQATQHQVTALAGMTVPPHRSQQCDDEVGRESLETRSALLPDDIKSSILTEMTKGPLKEHLVLNTAKLRDYDGEEIQNLEPVDMDVGAFLEGNCSK